MLALLLALVLVPQPQAETPQEGEAPPVPPPAPTAPPLLLRGGTVHSMLPGDPPRVADVLVIDGRIRAIGEGLVSDSDPRVIDVRGKHLVPGLIDAHVNFDPEHDALYVAAGVTLVRDLGGDHARLRLEKAAERRDLVPGPTLISAGAPLDGDPPAAATAVVLRSAEACENYLPILFEEGVDFLSVLPGLPEDAWRKAITMAHERELKVFGPRPARRTLADAIAGGQDGFHALDSLLPPETHWDGVTQDELGAAVVALAQARAPLVPLLYASALRLEDQEQSPVRHALASLLAPWYESWWRLELAQRQPYLAPEHRGAGEAVLAKQARLLAALFDAGAVLVPGSGAPQPWCLPGTSLHQELAQWVAAGLSPAAVLDLATRGAAQALGYGGAFGTLEEGVWGDVLVLDQDPSTDLAHLLDPVWVVVRGRPLGREEREAAVGALAERQAALRAELNAPVAVEPPPQGEEGAVLLEGTVESSTFGTRVSTERYRVVRLSTEVLLYTTRVVFPAGAQSSARELTLEQFVRNGRLEQVHASLREGEQLLEHDGLWTANTWRMQSRLDGKIVSSPAPFREQPVCVDSGCAVTLLILGQLPPGERIPVVQLHPAFDAEPVYWRLEHDEIGNHLVRTQIGYKVFRLDALGAVAVALSKAGMGTVETRALSSSGFGGAGLPPLFVPRPAPEEPAHPAEAGTGGR